MSGAQLFILVAIFVVVFVGCTGYYVGVRRIGVATDRKGARARARMAAGDASASSEDGRRTGGLGLGTRGAVPADRADEPTVRGRGDDRKQSG